MAAATSHHGSRRPSCSSTARSPTPRAGRASIGALLARGHRRRRARPTRCAACAPTRRTSPRSPAASAARCCSSATATAARSSPCGARRQRRRARLRRGVRARRGRELRRLWGGSRTASLGRAAPASPVRRPRHRPVPQARGLPRDLRVRPPASAHGRHGAHAATRDGRGARGASGRRRRGGRCPRATSSPRRTARIGPDAQRAMAERAGAAIAEIDGSHAIPLSRPTEVAAQIAAAVHQQQGAPACPIPTPSS